MLLTILCFQLFNVSIQGGTFELAHTTFGNDTTEHDTRALYDTLGYGVDAQSIGS